MKVKVSDIIYDDRTTEVTVSMNSLSRFVSYKDIPEVSQQFMGGGLFNEVVQSDLLCIDVPFSDFMSEIDKIYAYVEDYISKKTYKKVKKMKISEII